jgi:hypothetical protein
VRAPFHVSSDPITALVAVQSGKKGAIPINDAKKMQFSGPSARAEPGCLTQIKAATVGHSLSTLS